MCVGGPPKPPPLPTPRPTAPAPERTAKTVVTGAQRKKKSSAFICGCRFDLDFFIFKYKINF